MESISDLFDPSTECESKDPTSEPARSTRLSKETSEPPVLFVIGNSSIKPPPTKSPLISRHAISKPKSKLPKHVTSSRKSNAPVPRSVPLAFPAESSFTFSAANPDSTLVASAPANAPPNTVQILPTDVLTTIIQALQPRYRHQILLSLSLVNRDLNTAIGPLLYRRLRLPNLPDVYKFSLGPRHPTCISSLEMDLSPDPQRKDWTPPEPDWAEGLVCTLRKLEGLISLGIRHCGSDSVLQSLTKTGTDLSFLPGLQKLSLGIWHQLSSLCLGRPITSYDVTFTLHEIQAYEKFERLLMILSTSNEPIRELKIAFNISIFEETSPVGEYQRDALNLIGKHMPGLHVLKVRFHRRNSKINVGIDLAELVKAIPPTLDQLAFLEFSDSHFPLFSTESTVEAAEALVEQDGPCPKLQFVNFDGLLWKRTVHHAHPSASSSNTTLSLRFASLSFEKGRFDHTQSETLAPLMVWTPSPSNKRGRKWWERRVPKLHASSQTQAAHLLWHWMAEHWGKDHMVDITPLERTVTQW